MERNKKESIDGYVVFSGKLAKFAVKKTKFVTAIFAAKKNSFAAPTMISRPRKYIKHQDVLHLSTEALDITKANERETKLDFIESGILYTIANWEDAKPIIKHPKEVLKQFVQYCSINEKDEGVVLYKDKKFNLWSFTCGGTKICYGCNSEWPTSAHNQECVSSDLALTNLNNPWCCIIRNALFGSSYITMDWIK